MPTRKARAPEPEILVATIEEVDQTYFISELRGENRRVDDEAILGIVGRIERIGPARKQYLNQRIEMSFVCARSFAAEVSCVATGRPSLMSLQLRKRACSLIAYLPADAFWALPALISSRAISHVEARFDKPSYGIGDLQSLHFAPASKLEAVG